MQHTNTERITNTISFQQQTFDQTGQIQGVVGQILCKWIRSPGTRHLWLQWNQHYLFHSSQCCPAGMHSLIWVHCCWLLATETRANHTKLTIGGNRINYLWEVATLTLDFTRLNYPSISLSPHLERNVLASISKFFTSIHLLIVLNTCSSHWISSQQKSLANTI